MDPNELLRLACDTNFAYLALGNERFESHGASFIVNPRTPRRWDANCVGLIRTNSDSEFEALLQHAETAFAGYAHRSWRVDALTPSQSVARLALEADYRSTDELVHILEGDLRIAADRATPPPDVEIREVLSEDDWEAYRELDRMWWEETSTGFFGPYDVGLHAEFMVYHRLKTPQVRAWFACVGSVPRAFFNSWPGDNGVGIVEDLYCHPEYRHSGLATALIQRAVADCRERGAGPLIINSDPNDTPKQMYAAMGFRPFFVQRQYVRRLSEQTNASV